jgi:hypothetical protein
MRLRDPSDYIVYPFGISGFDGVVFDAAPLQIGNVAYWPEAAVHRDAAIRPQLEHKPTWRRATASTRSRPIGPCPPTAAFSAINKLTDSQVQIHATLIHWSNGNLQAANQHNER